MYFKRVVSKKLTDSARGNSCTLRIPGVCKDHEPGSVVACHINRPMMGGTSTKNHDFFIAYGCGSCHAWIDDSTNREHPKYYEWIIDALLETQSIMYVEGLISVKGAK